MGQEDPLKKGIAIHSSILAWRIHRQKSLVGYGQWVTKSWTLLSDLQTPTHMDTRSSDLAINLSLLTVFAIIRHGPAGQRVLLRLGFGFPDSFQPFPVLLTDLLAEEAVHQEDEDTLQAVDDGEEIGHDVGSRSHLQESQKPRASQDEELSCGFKCQHPRVLQGGHLTVEGTEFAFQNPKGHQKES
ncbi:hypothetical protein MG293_000045 [Ovis ammon polii]|uniref:Uncharacterized protein n=1 Tax=Ovis ammon polii TaxID=230172 RepID=A0AAD4UPY3_OVIAM|nr:hypothetical protein MG293_000045 [Ovis ammon polii]